MEREHLIIIALILVALYMMNNSSSKDKVTAMGPMGRIRYGECPGPDCIGNMGHIRTRREGFEADPLKADGTFPQHIRLGDKDWGHSQHIKNHIRSRNTNSMFSGMTTGCGSNTIETFRFTDECCGTTNAPGCNGSC
jgi:hypothetical protein